MNITVKIYDRKTQFNEVPVSVINAEFTRMWGDVPVVLVYNNDVFTGIAEPLGMRTLEEATAQYEASFAEQEAQAEAAKEQANLVEAINAKLDFLIMTEVL